MISQFFFHSFCLTEPDWMMVRAWLQVNQKKKKTGKSYSSWSSSRPTYIKLMDAKKKPKDFMMHLFFYNFFDFCLAFTRWIWLNCILNRNWIYILRTILNYTNISVANATREKNYIEKSIETDGKNGRKKKGKEERQTVEETAVLIYITYWRLKWVGCSLKRKQNINKNIENKEEEEKKI